MPAVQEPFNHFNALLSYVTGISFFNASFGCRTAMSPVRIQEVEHTVCPGSAAAYHDCFHGIDSDSNSNLGVVLF